MAVTELPIYCRSANLANSFQREIEGIYNPGQFESSAMMGLEVASVTPRIAFLVLAHGDAPLLLRLCARLSEHMIFVHVDAKTRDFPIAQLAALKNVVVLSPRVSVHWADFSMVEASLSLLESAMARNEQFSKFVLLSGGCYPVKPLRALASKFAGDGDHNYIRFTLLEGSPHLRNLTARHWRMSPFLPDSLLGRRRWLQTADKKARAVINKLSSYRARDFQAETGFVPSFGNSWWALSQPCVRYILKFVKEHAGFVQAHRSTYAPDELFYHTIIAQSPFAACSEGIQADMGARTNQAAPLHLIHPSEGRTFTNSDTDFALASTTEKYFIRKVNSRDTGALLDRVDRELILVS